MTAIPTSDVGVVRLAYAALGAGDFDQLERCFAHDAVWHEPGGDIYSGDRVGWPAIRDDFLALLGSLSHGKQAEGDAFSAREPPARPEVVTNAQTSW